MVPEKGEPGKLGWNCLSWDGAGRTSKGRSLGLGMAAESGRRTGTGNPTQVQQPI